MHMFSGKALGALLAATLGAGVLMGSAWQAGPARVAHVTPEMSVPVVPSGSPAASLPATEDFMDWDCRVQGNHVCMWQGERWLNVDHLPTSPYARCLLGLRAVSISDQVVALDAEQICEPLYVNG